MIALILLLLDLLTGRAKHEGVNPEPIPVDCVCHHGMSLCGLPPAAKDAHLRHEDGLGMCIPPPN
jgi:hypothetical protein